MLRRLCRLQFLSLILLLILLLIGSTIPAALAAWEPLPAEFLEIEDCPTEPGCSALLLQDDIIWDNDFDKTRMWHHRVIKVFTQEGLDAASVKIAKWVGQWEVREVEGRTVSPDGTVLKLKSRSALEETMEKGRGYRSKSVSFQMPGVEVGSILEYRYKRVFTVHLGYYTWWIQGEYPILTATMKIRSRHFSIRNIPVGLKGVSMKTTVGDDNFGVLTVRHVPSLKFEPFMPPVREASGRIVFRPSTRARSLRDMRAGYDGFLKGYYKRSSKAKKLARRILAEAESPEDQLLSAYHYIQKNFDNTWFRQSSEGEVVEGKNLYVDDVVVSGQGNGGDLTRLFVFLARQAGFQAEVALVATRDTVFFRHELRSRRDFSDELAAINLNGEWKFYDPGTPYIPAGMVSWEKEGVAPNALLPEGRMTTVPPSRAGDNQRKRTTRIVLDPDGGMTAEVEIEYHGLSGAGERNRVDHMTADERHQNLEEVLQELFPAAELEDLEYVNLKDWTRPLEVRYRVRVEQYATAVGGRLFVPMVLYPEQNPFTSEDRRHPIYFHQSMQEIDKATLEVPGGYEVESLPYGRTVDFRALRYRMRIRNEDPQVIATSRDLLVDTLLVEASDYDMVRELYEEAARVDGQQIVLHKLSEEPVEEGQGSP
ncbi:MAG: DUF3857 domain-containing protein [Acidobacteria bacterium]|nr:DUF3857 domain-containing protein [Acidobacteriota bacterium]